MIRHGRAAASFTDDLDPGLDALGSAQAEQVAEHLKSELPLKLISSPLKRAFETAQALQYHQPGDIQIDERVSEIPSPGLSLEERGPWLRKVMSGTWPEQDQALKDWREALVQCLISQQEDCAIFSHFVAINVVTGFAEGDDRLTLFRPDNTSVTELTTDGSLLSLVQRGSEAVTAVN
jgi:broad specificity phosphatase PhoE